MKPFLPTKLSSLNKVVFLAVLGLMSLLFVGKNETPTKIDLVKSNKSQAAHDCSQHAALAHTDVSNAQKAAAKKLIQDAVSQKIKNDWSSRSGMSLCWAEDTDPAVIEDFYRNATPVFPGTNVAHGLNTSFGGDGTGGRFELNPRWFFNAENPISQVIPVATIPQGSCFTLTWSFIPDGTSIFGFNNEPTSPSQLIAYLDGVYGCTSTADLTQSCWFSLFTDVFDDWAEKTGVSYRYVADDGAPLTGFPPFLPDGLLGARGDVRIGGHPVDGDGGILAYNFFPGPFLDGILGVGPFGTGNFINGGDMVIDVPDLFYTINLAAADGAFDANNSRRFRNVVAHEHGHGLGLAHSCPLTGGSKLMEPLASLIPAFDGAQEDDFTGANALYGDRYCNTPALHVNGIADFASIDNSTEVDEFTFSISTKTTIDLTLRPTGTEYLAGPQNMPLNPGSCSDGVLFDALRQANLDMDIIGPNGSVIASASATPAGEEETITSLILATNGTYTVRVRNNGELDVQMYELECSLVPIEVPTMSQWGLIIFGLLILNLGVVFVYKQDEMIA